MSRELANPAKLALAPPVLYPEKQRKRQGILDKAVTSINGWLKAASRRKVSGRPKRIARKAGKLEQHLSTLSMTALSEMATELRGELRLSGFSKQALVARSFAIIREISKRILGQRHYDVQLIAGVALLDGQLAEMETGEGKTLTATLAAGTAALAGIPVHVMTVNDYLAKRDAELMQPVYELLGLSVGIVVQGCSPFDRKAAYACDITYCTNKEIAFDYLRDRMKLGGNGGNLALKLDRFRGGDGVTGELLLRGLHFAIVDEADSILVDEARTPLIISGAVGSTESASMLKQALSLAGQLREDRDYQVLQAEQRILLTKAGRDQLEALAATMGKAWQGKILREERAQRALTALLLFHRDEHYLVRDGKVEIVDEFTGRIMKDRFWGQGLHQMVEVKEGFEPSDQRKTVARMTYQRFFRRYRRLSGMTGTAREITSELWKVYHLPVVRIPTNKPVQRKLLRTRVLATNQKKWHALTLRVQELNRRGCPILIGTRSVKTSEEASDRLEAAGLPHIVLNAAQDENEAQIVAQAGQAGRITVATNMAGRGTDIKISDEVVRNGGLHVIMTERHDASRIDRQLAGRCSRQGQPGCFQSILSMEDPLMEMDTSGLMRRLEKSLRTFLGEWAGRLVVNLCQKRAEKLHAGMRAEMLKADENLGDILAFTGEME